MHNNKDLKTVHPEYSANIQRWRFYSDSYQGGAAYRYGEYLNKYQLETAGEYQQRLDEAPYENHCRRVVDTYSSFIYGATIERDYGSLANNPNLKPFLEDTDLDGRNWKQLWREASKWASVYGAIWLLVDKAESNAGTRAEELGQGIRPYVSLISAENVLDWHYERQSSGHMMLTYLKVLADRSGDKKTYKIYYPDYTETVEAYDDDEFGQTISVVPNALGEIPAVVLYNNRTWHNGIGVSDIADVSDLNRSITSDYSEIAQLIKLSNHPTLVKPTSVEVPSAGAGSILNIDLDTPGDLKPYLMTPSGQNISTLLDTINRKVEAIEKLTHLESVTGQKTARSGVAMMIEQKALASLLSDKAANLQLAEEQVWRLFCLWEGTAWDGTITYPDSFDTRDRQQDLMNLKLATEIGVTNADLKKYIEQSIASAIVDDSEDLERINQSIITKEHPVTTAENRSSHIQEMIMEGLTDQQILDLHSEISQSDIDTAKQELLDSNGE